MAGNGWHLRRSGDGALTLSRRWPPRFDVAAEAVFPPLRAAVLAHEVRKDLWRHLQDLRGFSPVLRIDPAEEGLRLRAGGRIDGPPPPPGTAARIAALLADPARRARWIAHPGRRRPEAGPC